MQQMQQMQIQGTEIQIKEYQGKRVVTLKDIDAVHQRKSGTASRTSIRTVTGSLKMLIFQDKCN